jgi:hypothetical protein
MKMRRLAVVEGQMRRGIEKSAPQKMSAEDDFFVEFRQSGLLASLHLCVKR